MPTCPVEMGGSSASQHETVDHGAGLGSVSGIAEQPRFSSGGKNSDLAFQNVVIDRHPAVAGVTRQVIPLVQGVGHRIAELGIRHDLWRLHFISNSRCPNDPFSGSSYLPMEVGR